MNDVDEVLATTRSVRLRLDLEKPVADQTILECIDLAEQAPTGGNQSSRRWMVIRDPEKKQALADLYFGVAGQFMVEARDKLEGTGHANEKIMRSAAHLVEHLAEVPAIVIPTIWGTHDGSGKPGLFDSVIQSAWSFMLALRARGMGSAYVTAILNKEDEVRELLGIPEGITQIVMLPVAHTIGTDFKAANRRPADEITYFDRWGNTSKAPTQVGPTAEQLPGVVTEIEIEASPRKLWPLITDINLPGRFSEEFMGAEWENGAAGPSLGATFLGTNDHPARGQFQTQCHIVVCEENVAFGWNTSDPDLPGAQWRFELDPLHGNRTRLRYTLTIGPGRSGISEAIDAMPDKETKILSRRQDEHRGNMMKTIEGIRALAEGGGTE